MIPPWRSLLDSAMAARFLALALLALPLAQPAAAQDAADFVVRMNRLENQVRQMSGHIEQLQFENRQLKDQLRKFEEDIEFRFQESAGARGETGRATTSAPAAMPPPSASQTPAMQPPRAQRRGDAFDPSAAPYAPGAPMPLGTTPPSASLPPNVVAGVAPGPGGPPRGAIGSSPTIEGLIDDEDGPPPGAAPLDLSAAGRVAAAPAPRPAPSIAATGSGNARTDYDAAYAYILQKQYEQAEMGLRQFLQSHPRDRLVPDAIYWLGESYLQRSRPREAAEQFLKVSTEHARSNKAPDAMLKLGIALNALGARDQACATFAELGRKYPEAASVRQGAEREQKRARCA
jgi:tol-pal system protein YbgF